MVVAVNMMDVVDKRGDVINLKILSEKIGCPAVDISALKGKGVKEAAVLAKKQAEKKMAEKRVHKFDDRVEEALNKIEAKLSNVEESKKRFVAIKLLERDDKISGVMDISVDVESIVADLEKEMNDDSESIITNERYNYITSIIDQ